MLKSVMEPIIQRETFYVDGIDYDNLYVRFSIDVSDLLSAGTEYLLDEIKLFDKIHI